jgi:hypothetical protein
MNYIKRMLKGFFKTTNNNSVDISLEKVKYIDFSEISNINIIVRKSLRNA